MKSRPSLKPRISPRLKLKQALVYVAAGIGLAVAVSVGIFIYLNLGNSHDSKAAADHYPVRNGNWTDAATWAGGAAPPTSGIDANIDILETVSHIGNLSYASSSTKTLTVTDTLIIDGDLTMGNTSNLVVKPGGVLVITGNFFIEEKPQNCLSIICSNTTDLLVENNGVIATKGDMTFPKNVDGDYATNGGSLYAIGGIYNTTATNRSSYLQTEQPAIYNYFFGGTPLPIKLLYFKAQLQDDVVITAWATEEEINNDYFTVERSADGKTFQAVGTVAGAGDSQAIKTYTYTDHAPLKGRAYYRLKQTDFDGKSEDSNIVVVSNPLQQQDPDGLTVHAVGPNPFEQDFSVDFQLASQGAVELRLMNIQGHVVASQTIEASTGSNRYVFTDTDKLRPGTYLLHLIHNNTASKAFRIIKN